MKQAILHKDYMCANTFVTNTIVGNILNAGLLYCNRVCIQCSIDTFT